MKQLRAVLAASLVVGAAACGRTPTNPGVPATVARDEAPVPPPADTTKRGGNGYGSGG
jgi:hypothetical protein